MQVLPILFAMKCRVPLPITKNSIPCIWGNVPLMQSREIAITEQQARWCSPLIRGIHYCICQFNTNHVKLSVPDKGITFYLVISIETKEFAEIFHIWFHNHIFLNITFKNQHWFSRTGNWKQKESDGNKWVISNCYSLLISQYFKN